MEALHSYRPLGEYTAPLRMTTLCAYWLIVGVLMHITPKDQGFFCIQHYPYDKCHENSSLAFRVILFSGKSLCNRYCNVVFS